MADVKGPQQTDEQSAQETVASTETPPGVLYFTLSDLQVTTPPPAPVEGGDEEEPQPEDPVWSVSVHVDGPASAFWPKSEATEEQVRDPLSHIYIPLF